jgi:hypothetical protein
MMTPTREYYRRTEQPTTRWSLSQPDSIIDKLRAGDSIKALGVVIEICRDDRRPTIRLNLSDVHRPMLHRYTRATLPHAAQFAGSSQKPDVGATAEEAETASQKRTLLIVIVLMCALPE